MFLDPYLNYLNSCLKNLLDEYINEYKKDGPPFLAEEIAEIRKVKEIQRVEMNHDGLLIPVKGGFIIQLNKRHPYAKQNYTCAHEVAHTFFYDLNRDPPKKIINLENEVEEYLCNLIAARMLIPEEYLRDVKRKVPSIQLLIELSNKFCVSINTMARRITKETGIWKCIVICWRKNKIGFNREWIYAPKDLEKRCMDIPLYIKNDTFGVYSAYRKGKIKKEEKLKLKSLNSGNELIKTPVIVESCKLSKNLVTTIINFPNIIRGLSR